MTDEEDDELSEGRRERAMELAIDSNLQTNYDKEGKLTTDVDKLIASAKAIENYLKGETK